MARKPRDLFGLEREDAVRKQKIRLLLSGAAVALVVIIIFAVVHFVGRAGGTQVAVPHEETVSSETVLPTEEPTPSAKLFPQVELPSDEAFSRKITIMSTGDNLIHEAIYEDAEAEDEEGYYDFRNMYEYVKPYVEAADLATVNMETPLATSIGKPSGYPHFNSPRGAGYVLIDTGFDIINHANNHVMDMGTDGVYATLDYWAEHDTPVVGAYRNGDDLYTMRVLESNGIKVAFLGIAEFTNYEIPEDSSIRVPLFSDGSLVEELIKTARESADVVVVHAHWGEENEDVLTETMEVMSQRMIDWGADIIFGNHTHIVQELKMLTRESDGKLCPVFFCGGNFISGQKERAHLLSGLEYVTVAQNPDTGEIQIQNVQFLPVVTHYEGDRHNVRIYPLDQYTDELAAVHGVVEFEGEPMTIPYLDELLKKHIPEQFLVTTDTLELTKPVQKAAEIPPKEQQEAQSTQSEE